MSASKKKTLLSSRRLGPTCLQLQRTQHIHMHRSRQLHTYTTERFERAIFCACVAYVGCPLFPCRVCGPELGSFSKTAQKRNYLVDSFDSNIKAFIFHCHRCRHENGAMNDRLVGLSIIDHLKALSKDYFRYRCNFNLNVKD